MIPFLRGLALYRFAVQDHGQIKLEASSPGTIFKEDGRLFVYQTDAGGYYFLHGLKA